MVIAAAIAAASPVADARQALKRTEVCFTVHNLGDAIASTVRGTLFRTSAYTAKSTALLLQHGAVAERSAIEIAPTWMVPVLDESIRVSFSEVQ